MNLEEELLKEHSKHQTLKIANYIGNDSSKFAALMKLVLGNNELLCQRSAWVMSSSFDKHPQLIAPYLRQLIDNLSNNVHDAVKRNSLRILQHIDIPEELQGTACNICFNLLQSNDTAIAIKVFAMTVIKNICKQEPELTNELISVLQLQMPTASSGFISRANKILKEVIKKDKK
jgi:hypothetical protein